MKLKSFKKVIKQHLFNFNISKNAFLIFEIKKKIIHDLNFVTVKSYSKQIFNKIKQKNFQNIKFPIIIKKVNSLANFLKYFLTLKVQEIFLVKIHFILLKKTLFFLKLFFFDKKILKFFFYIFLKKKGFIFHLKSLFYPFIII
jgi:hypothetical protein